MKRIAKFHKVSFEQFKEGWMGEFPQTTEAKLQKIYEDIKLPKRATAGSAGYDFYTPETFSLKSGETIKIPTGIRVEMEEGWVLKLYPRSGLGFKYRLQLDNSVGIIDSDYFYSDNEGHMFAKITNDAKQEKTLTVEKGQGFMQGIFVEYGITVDDEVTKIQERLKELGYYDGEVNGKFDDATEAAYIQFQQAAGVDVDGIQVQTEIFFTRKIVLPMPMFGVTALRE